MCQREILSSGSIHFSEVRSLKRTNWVAVLCGSIGMIILILDGKTAVSGITAGLDICMRTLIPSLFPFFVLSTLVTGNLIGKTSFFGSVLSGLCRMPQGTESLFLVGILGGYPLGAKNIADSYHSGQINQNDAVRMASFCNNAGPAFIFGILGPLFPDQSWVWALWVIQVISGVLTGCILSGSSGTSVKMNQRYSVTITTALSGGVRSMALVSGWVILFRMVLEFLNRWFLWLIPIQSQVLFTGFLELANGCLNLRQISGDSVRFLMSSVMLSMGGICVWMQTKSVFPELNMIHYLKGRAIHCINSLLLSIAAIPILLRMKNTIWICILIFLTIPILMAGFRKKEVAIP